MRNFAVSVVEAAPPQRLALVELARDGARREWRFGEVANAARWMAAELHRRGVHRGDVVLTLVGNRPDWVVAMVACFRQGFVVLPCNEQLRAKDLRLRLAACPPALVVCDARNTAVLAEAGWDGETIVVPGPLPERDPPPPAELEPTDPCLITFTSGTAGEPKAVVHGQRYLAGQALQAEHWLAPRAGDLVWCTAASGWSKSARNVFVAPWIRGAAALLHDARFDPAERLDVLGHEGVGVLCMAPTEYRVIAKRATLRPLPALHGLVAAGEALNPEVLRAWQEATGLQIRDGYGQTETGQLTGMPPGEQVRPGSMGRPLPGVSLAVDDGELVVDPETVPTFFLRYAGERAPGGPVAHRRPRRARRGRLPVLRGPHRRRDHLGGLPDRPVRGRVGPRRARGRRRGRGRRGARRGARQHRARGRGAARRLCGVRRARARPAGPRQGPDRAVQVPAPRRVRHGAAEDGKRQGPPRAAARR